MPLVRYMLSCFLLFNFKLCNFIVMLVRLIIELHIVFLVAFLKIYLLKPTSLFTYHRV
jgi:hypothetical protein